MILLLLRLFMKYSACLRSWGVCFTYGVWFGLEAFACMGHTFQNGYVICFVFSYLFSLNKSTHILYLTLVAGLFVWRWNVPVSSCCRSRWRMEAGVRTLSHVSSGATFRARTHRSTTPAGLCWGWWLSGNISSVLDTSTELLFCSKTEYNFCVGPH